MEAARHRVATEGIRPELVGGGEIAPKAPGADRSMRTLTSFLSGLMCLQIAATAQANNNNPTSDRVPAAASAKTGVIGADQVMNDATYESLTASERLGHYLVGAFGPEAIVRAAAAAGISQWNGTPREWGQGAEAYGDRLGSALAEHIIRETMESGAAALLHEDDRYLPSVDTGFGKRVKHAVFSAFIAYNDAGRERLALARLGSAVGASFISRSWQPPSENTAGDAADNFGLTMAVDIGWNVFREFCPKGLRRHL
jgi:hypothetical protein